MHVATDTPPDVTKGLELQMASNATNDGQRYTWQSQWDRDIVVFFFLMTGSQHDLAEGIQTGFSGIIIYELSLLLYDDINNSKQC